MKNYFLYIMSAAYVFAGVNHFWHTGFYTHITPPYIPFPDAIVYISGVAEILCGLGLLLPATRKAAAWGIVALLVAVSPVHINMALHPENFSEVPLVGIYLRLPLQLFLIWLAYIYTKD
jgi:uncharacterized membrane protein